MYLTALSCSLLLLQARPQPESVESLLAAIERNYERFRALPGLFVSCSMEYQHVRGQNQFPEAPVDVINARAGDKVYVQVNYRQSGEKWDAAWNTTVGTASTFPTYRILRMPPPRVHAWQAYIDRLFYPQGFARNEDPEGIYYLPGYTKGPDYWLPAGLKRNIARYRVLPARESVDGADCVVLEWPGRDRLWLDPQLGYAIRRRDFREAGVMRDRVYLREFENVAEGLWLPRLIVHEQYCTRRDPPDLRNQISGIRTLRVNTLRVEPLPEEQFVVQVPKGAYVKDLVRGMEYEVLDPSEAQRRIALVERQVRRELSGNRSRWWVYLASIAVAATVTVLAWGVYRRWLRS